MLPSWSSHDSFLHIQNLQIKLEPLVPLVFWTTNWSLCSSSKDILVFLTEAFNEGLAYRSINVLRPAISSTHPSINRYSVGQHPYIIRLLKEALNTRTPQPGKNSPLTLNVISVKLVTLFALTCPERISALVTLDLKLYCVHPEELSFRQLNVQGSFCAWCFNDSSRQRVCPIVDCHVYGWLVFFTFNF